jgi:hypothetical protein
VKREIQVSGLDTQPRVDQYESDWLAP